METTLYQCGHTLAEFASGSINKWGRKDISYFVTGYPVGLGLSSSDVEDCLDTIAKQIMEICDLRVFRAKSEQTCQIRMGIGRGRRAGFDGPMGILAYCYLPQGPRFDGQLDLMWDMDEPWDKNPHRNAIALGHVTFHELLHGLGIDHTTVPNQLMNATYAANIAVPQEHDRKELVDRYGRPLSNGTTTTLPPNLPLPPAGPHRLEVQCRLDNGQVYAGELFPVKPGKIEFGLN